MSDAQYQIFNLGESSNGNDALSQAIQDSLSNNGLQTPLNMNNNKIINVGYPSQDKDAATLEFVYDVFVSQGNPGQLAPLNVINGALPLTQNLDLRNSSHTVQTRNPVSGQEVSTKSYTDTQDSSLQSQINAEITNRTNADTNLQGQITTQGTSITTLTNKTLNQIPLAVSDVNLNNNKIINLSDPVNLQDASTKAYVDDVFGTTQQEINTLSSTKRNAVDSIAIIQSQYPAQTDLNLGAISSIRSTKPITQTDQYTTKSYVDTALSNINTQQIANTVNTNSKLVANQTELTNGQTPLNMNSQKITSLSAGTLNTDAVNKGQMDTADNALQSQITTNSSNITTLTNRKLNEISAPTGSVNLNNQDIVNTKNIYANSTTATHYGDSYQSVSGSLNSKHVTRQELNADLLLQYGDLQGQINLATSDKVIGWQSIPDNETGFSLLFASTELERGKYRAWNLPIIQPTDYDAGNARYKSQPVTSDALQYWPINRLAQAQANYSMGGFNLNDIAFASTDYQAVPKLQLDSGLAGKMAVTQTLQGIYTANGGNLNLGSSRLQTSYVPSAGSDVINKTYFDANSGGVTQTSEWQQWLFNNWPAVNNSLQRSTLFQTIKSKATMLNIIDQTAQSEFQFTLNAGTYRLFTQATSLGSNAQTWIQFRDINTNADFMLTLYPSLSAINGSANLFVQQSPDAGFQEIGSNCPYIFQVTTPITLKAHIFANQSTSKLALRIICEQISGILTGSFQTNNLAINSNLDFATGNYKIQTSTPTNNSDATTKLYVDQALALKYDATVTLQYIQNLNPFSLDMGSNRLQTSYVPSAGSDVINKTYFDANIGGGSSFITSGNNRAELVATNNFRIRNTSQSSPAITINLTSFLIEENISDRYIYDVNTAGIMQRFSNSANSLFQCRPMYIQSSSSTSRSACLYIDRTSGSQFTSKTYALQILDNPTTTNGALFDCYVQNTKQTDMNSMSFIKAESNLVNNALHNSTQNALSVGFLPGRSNADVVASFGGSVESYQFITVVPISQIEYKQEIQLPDLSDLENVNLYQFKYNKAKLLEEYPDYQYQINHFINTEEQYGFVIDQHFPEQYTILSAQLPGVKTVKNVGLLKDRLLQFLLQERRIMKQQIADQEQRLRQLEAVVFGQMQ